MLIENMKMAFTAIRSNKMRSALTMLGIIIGIGSVISIVSIGDTMRGLFTNLYKDVGITQAYVSTAYWMVDDFKSTDYFTLDQMDQVKEAFKDQIAYIDSGAADSSDAVYNRTKVKFDYQGIDYNYQDVQPVNIVYGRYLNEGDVLGRKKNVVMDTDSALKLFGVEDAVGRSFRTTIDGDTDDYTVVGIYKKDVNAFEALLMGSSNKDKGSAFIPYTLLTWPNSTFSQLHVFAKSDVDLNEFFAQLKIYVAKLHDREPAEIQVYTAIDEMKQVDSVMGGLSMAVGGIAAISLLVGGIGIMNIMLVSVTERTREIGIRKALGARTRDVLIQFLTESALLSACGGLIGVALGAGLVSLGGLLFHMPVVIKPEIILVAVTFSAVVGIFFGLYPASKAAGADPIDALRYE